MAQFRVSIPVSFFIVLIEEAANYQALLSPDGFSTSEEKGKYRNSAPTLYPQPLGGGSPGLGHECLPGRGDFLLR